MRSSPKPTPTKKQETKGEEPYHAHSTEPSYGNRSRVDDALVARSPHIDGRGSKNKNAKADDVIMSGFLEDETTVRDVRSHRHSSSSFDRILTHKHPLSSFNEDPLIPMKRTRPKTANSRNSTTKSTFNDTIETTTIRRTDKGAGTDILTIAAMTVTPTASNHQPMKSAEMKTTSTSRQGGEYHHILSKSSPSDSRAPMQQQQEQVSPERKKSLSSYDPYYSAAASNIEQPNDNNTKPGASPPSPSSSASSSSSSSSSASSLLTVQTTGGRTPTTAITTSKKNATSSSGISSDHYLSPKQTPSLLGGRSRSETKALRIAANLTPEGGAESRRASITTPATARSCPTSLLDQESVLDEQSLMVDDVTGPLPTTSSPLLMLSPGQMFSKADTEHTSVAGQAGEENRKQQQQQQQRLLEMENEDESSVDDWATTTTRLVPSQSKNEISTPTPFRSLVEHHALAKANAATPTTTTTRQCRSSSSKHKNSNQTPTPSSGLLLTHRRAPLTLTPSSASQVRRTFSSSNNIVNNSAGPSSSSSSSVNRVLYRPERFEVEHPWSVGSDDPGHPRPSSSSFFFLVHNEGRRLLSYTRIWLCLSTLILMLGTVILVHHVKHEHRSAASSENTDGRGMVVSSSMDEGSAQQQPPLEIHLIPLPRQNQDQHVNHKDDIETASSPQIVLLPLPDDSRTRFDDFNRHLSPLSNYQHRPHHRNLREDPQSAFDRTERGSSGDGTSQPRVVLLPFPGEDEPNGRVEQIDRPQPLRMEQHPVRRKHHSSTTKDPELDLTHEAHHAIAGRNPNHHHHIFAEGNDGDDTMMEEEDLRHRFRDWIARHGKVYPTSDERERRFRIWTDNHKKTAEKNRRHGPCKLTNRDVFGSNHFQDLTAEEFRMGYLNAQRPTGNHNHRMLEVLGPHISTTRHPEVHRRIQERWEQQPPSMERLSEQVELNSSAFTRGFDSSGPEDGRQQRRRRLASSSSGSGCDWYDISCLLQWIFSRYIYGLGGTMEPAYDEDSYPDAVDWRDVGAVGDVRSQGNCGGCWAITAVETVESALFIATEKLYELSETEIILCEGDCEMCSGGWPQNAFEYIINNGGVPLLSDVSYDGDLLYEITAAVAGESDELSEDSVQEYLSQTCPASDSHSGDGNNGGGGSSYSRHGGKIRGYGYATDKCVCYTDGSGCDCDSQNEGLAVRNLATYGPAVVCLDASVWQDYAGGVLTANSGCSSHFMDVNHCVQAVGYAFTSDDGDDGGGEGGDGGGNSHDSGSGSHDSRDSGSSRQGYWIVRNQWSTYWGMNGYAYISMGDNTCGILNDMIQAYT